MWEEEVASVAAKPSLAGLGSPSLLSCAPPLVFGSPLCFSCNSPLYCHQTWMYVLISELKLTCVYKILEMDTYRYHGHSMSDPGSTYRTCDKISNERQERDPIERVRKLLLAHDIASEKELKVSDLT